MSTEVSGVCVDKAGRVAIQHAVARAADEAEASYGLLSDGERLARLLAAADDIATAGVACGVDPQSSALVQLAAEATLWAEALQAGAAR